MSLETYKVLHLVGVFMVMAGLCARPLVGWLGAESPAAIPARKLSGMTHGGGLAIVLIAGFGMLARGGYSPSQPWVLGKLLIWIILGGMVAVAARMPRKAGLIWLLAFLLGGAAAYLAIFKPGM